MAGYNEILRRIEPEKIICYNTPFPEMQGNIVYVDYEQLRRCTIILIHMIFIGMIWPSPR